MKDVFHYAADRGVNYVDVLMPQPDYRDNIGRALDGIRDKFVISGPIGVALEGGQNKNEEAEVLAPGGLADLAHRLVKEGKARAVGASTHTPQTAMSLAASGAVFAGSSPSASKQVPIPLTQALSVFSQHGVALVGMKPFGGGGLLLPHRRVRPTPVQCLSFVLSHPEIACTVAGVRNVGELEADLRYLEATDEEKDFAPVLAALGSELASGCTYCNHCLPCPVEVNVGETLRLLDMAEILNATHGGGFVVRDDYAALPVKASDCTACRACADAARSGWTWR